MPPSIINAIRNLRDFAENHADDVYEPDENPQWQEDYDDIMDAVNTITNYLNETA